MPRFIRADERVHFDRGEVETCEGGVVHLDEAGTGVAYGGEGWDDGDQVSTVGVRDY